MNALLDKKLKDGDITKRQHDDEAARLNAIDQQAQKKAAANGDYLTGDQEGAFIQRFQHAYYIINHNFVVE